MRVQGRHSKQCPMSTSFNGTATTPTSEERRGAHDFAASSTGSSFLRPGDFDGDAAPLSSTGQQRVNQQQAAATAAAATTLHTAMNVDELFYQIATLDARLLTTLPTSNASVVCGTFENILACIVRDPTNVQQWCRLFAFPKLVLRKLPRGSTPNTYLKTLQVARTYVGGRAARFRIRYRPPDSATSSTAEPCAFVFCGGIAVVAAVLHAHGRRTDAYRLC